jgi:phosphatidylglycerophosphatase A
MRTLVVLVASLAYVGYIPVASGTFGTLVAMPLFWVFDALRSVSTTLPIIVFLAFVAGACWVAGRADAYLHEHDSHKIVIDEAAGYVAATLFLPLNWQTAVAAFFIFRALDVIKPYPAGYIDQHLPGGPGVVLDDVVSGFYTNLIIRGFLLIGVLAS